MAPLIVKVCGLSTDATLEAALAAGADMVGFVFFPPSPRHLALDRARDLAGQARGRAQTVALTVDADDAELDAIVEAMSPDRLQLHGRETPERAAALRHRYGVRITKALGVAVAADLDALARYADVADGVLLDAKPRRDATRPGGNARAFDWGLLAGARIETPWMLSGGLDADNIAAALRATGATGVDVSSGVESAPGVKDVGKIAAFVRRARAAALGSSVETA